MNVFTLVLGMQPKKRLLSKPFRMMSHLIIQNVKRLGMVSLVLMIASSGLLADNPDKIQNIDQVEISLELENESLLDAFKKIEELSPFHFMYRNEDVKDIVNLNASAGKRSVKAILETLLANTSLSYKQIDKRILISKESRKSSAIEPGNPQPSELVDLQQTVVSGRVTDSEGEGLPGVNIMVKETTIGTVTDVKGDYRLTVPDNAETLVFTSIGYLTEEVKVGNQNEINISMVEDIKSLSEVVVTAFGLEREKKSLSYATQEVETQQISEARELNVVNSLQGKVAGLSINTSGAGVGSEARVVLRGNRSISGDNQPLYVIDGVPTQGSPQDLSPDMISSINVLKGPNAAALYGSAAQNGAIIIETIRGRKGEVKVSLNNTFMIQDPSIPLSFQNEYGQGIGGNYDNRSEEAWGPKMNGQMVDHWSLDPESPSQYAFTADPDNKRDAFQRGHNLASNVIATMGGDKTQSLFSYTLTNAEGIVPNNELTRHNAAVRINSELTNRLKLDTKLEFMQQKLNNRIVHGASNYNPVMQIYKLPPNIQSADIRNYDYINQDGFLRQNFFNPNTTIGANPYWTMNRNLNETSRTRALLMTSLTYAITEDLQVMARGAYDMANNTGEEIYYNDTYTRAPNGAYSVNKNESSMFNGEFLFTYSKDVTSDWDVNVNFGGATRSLRSNSISASASPLVVPNFFAINNAVQPGTSFYPGSNTDLQSLYAFGQLAYKNALFLDITGRNDWSSTLPVHSRSYFYPSVGLAAVVSDLLTLPDAFSLIKLRGSWAEVGAAASPYMLSRQAYFGQGGRNGFLRLSNQLPNPDLRPETTRSTEIGVDIRFLQNRLGLDLTAYKTNTIDQLFTISLPVGSGAGSYYTNGGNVENKGVEAVLSATPVARKNLTWDMSLNFALNRNMVTAISDERPSIRVGGDGYLRDYIVEQGEPFGQIYALNAWQRDEQNRVIVGEDGVPLAGGERRAIGNFMPQWQGGFFNNISAGNFNLSFLIEHRQGGDIVSFTNAILDGSGLTEKTLAGRDGGLVFGENLFPDEIAVTEEGSSNNTEVDAETFWRATGNRNAPYAEAFVEDATSTRLREMTLGYTLPEALVSGLNISNVRISLVGRNLFFLYRASDSLEPDFLSQGTGAMAEGFQAFAPPTTRSYGFNLKIDF